MKTNYHIGVPDVLPYDPVIDYNQTSGTNSIASSQDGEMVVKKYRNFNFSGGTITTTNRCQGLMFIIDGDCYINGTITMTARGANAAVSNKSLNTDTLLLEQDNANNLYRWINGGSGSCGNGGNGVSGRRGVGGAGSAGTIASGGAGGGGACEQYNFGATKYGGGGGANGGAGGGGACGCDQSAAAVGGGAGNNGGGACRCGFQWGSVPMAYAGANGTGGTIIIIVRGKLTIGPNGRIISNGSDGGYGPHANGGGSGGGSITIIYGDTYSNSGSINVNGGWPNGGTGTIRIYNDPSFKIKRDLSEFIFPNLEPSVNRWIQDFHANSYVGHFEQPISSPLSNSLCFVRIDNIWCQVKSISGDGTSIGSVEIDTIMRSNRIHSIIPIKMTPNGTICFNEQVPIGSKYLFYTSVINGIEFEGINNISKIDCLTQNNVRIALSYDDKKTWYVLENKNWKQIELDQIETLGMTSEIINAISQKDLNVLLHNDTMKLDFAIYFNYDTELPIFHYITVDGRFTANTYGISFIRGVNETPIDLCSSFSLT